MPIDMTSLLNVKKPEAKQASETLARAFYDYPLLRYFFPDDRTRKKMAYYFVASGVFSGIANGEVYATSVDMEGVAVWQILDNGPLKMSKMIRSVPFSVILGLLMNGFYRMRIIGDHLDGMHERLAPSSHMYLHILGVDPRHQGKGFSGKLVRPMLARLDEEKLPCYLETIDEKNIAIYEHFGFGLIEESKIPGTELINWAMLREPGK